MSTFLPLLAAGAASIFIYELINGIVNSGAVRLDRFSEITDIAPIPEIEKSNSFYALLVVLFPSRFDVSKAKDIVDVENLIKRSGYYYSTPGEFYAAAIMDFSRYLLIGVFGAVALFMMGQPLFGIIIVGLLSFIGLRKPYSRLREVAKKRQENLLNNMLICFVIMEAVMKNSVGAQDAMRYAARMGGPFANILGLLVAQMDKNAGDVTTAIKVVRDHLPNPDDIEANLFLNDIEALFTKSRPMLDSLIPLRESVYNLVVEKTEERSALVRQRANLFGITAVVGLLISLIAPFMGVGF